MVKRNRLWIVSDNCRVLGVIRGLEEERALVHDFFTEFDADIVGLSISPEEVIGLQHYLGSNKENVSPAPLSQHDKALVRFLSRFGRVCFPPPAYEEAVKLCLRLGKTVVALEPNDTAYARIFCESIGGRDLILHSFRASMLKHKRFRAKSVEEFMILWKKATTKERGYKKLERKICAHIAAEIAKHMNDEGCFAALIDYERVEMVLGLLRCHVATYS